MDVGQPCNLIEVDLHLVADVGRALYSLAFF